MIIVTGTIELDPSGIDKARAAAAEMMTETHKEAGCHVYEFSQVIGSDTVFRVYEEWEDMEALTAHFHAPHMVTFRAAMAEVGVVARNIFRMQAGERTAI